MSLTTKEKQSKALGIFLVFFVILLSLGIAVSGTFFQTQTRISIEKKVQLEHVLARDKNIEIVFFGYTGCVNICTPRLQYLAKMYESFPKQIQEKVDVVFMDISNPAEISMPDQFAKNFHKDFVGIYLSKDILREYTKAFSVYFSRSLFDKTEYNHTTNLYIVAKKSDTKAIRYVYNTYPYNQEQIIADIRNLIDE